MNCDFITGAFPIDGKTIRLVEHFDEQRQAEQLFLFKLADVLDDCLRKKSVAVVSDHPEGR